MDGPLTESYTGGTLAGLSVERTYDAYLRLQDVSAKRGSTTLQGATYGYDTAGRVQSLTDGSYNANYTYAPWTMLVNTVSFQAGTTRMTTFKQFDRLNRLQSIRSAPAASEVLPISHSYHYNQANQRDNAMLADGSYWVYEYDSLGQVKSGKRYWSDGTVVAGQQFEYGFDDIGNRSSTKAGGNENGAGLRSATYTPDTFGLNQYTNRTVPRAFDVLGLANVAATVTVNSDTTYRKGEYYRKEVTVATGSDPAYTAVTATAALSGYTNQTGTGYTFTPAATEWFTHDADGNLTRDGLWDYAWDGENRLVQMTTRTDVTVAPARRIEFEYDWQGRRIGKKVYDARTGGTLLSTARFLYDGWNLLAELDASNNRVRTFMWGLDISGSVQGAGGVGGLLKVAYYGATTTNAFVAYDGNGNVMGLLDSTTANWVARYEYGPFGELIRASGPMAKANPFRFSTKYQDDETDLLYYGYRYYGPSTGRWLSRDRQGEQGGLNLYGFVKNCPVSLIDVLGLGTWHIDFPGNGTPDPGVDVYYSLTPHELKCCPKATVDRYVVDIVMVTTTLDQDSGGFWDPVTSSAHAEPDQPVGVGIRWPPYIGPVVYRMGQNFHFKWKARCTEGSPGKILSAYEAWIASPGHKEGSPFTYTWSPDHGF